MTLTLATAPFSNSKQHSPTFSARRTALFLPTGTLANNLAVRILCGDHKHALVQAESHLYADESDSASILSGLTLDPLAPGKAAPSYEEIAGAIDSAKHRPYPIRIGAISIESPVRRADGASVPYETLARISALAKSEGIGMHWDGARSMLLTGTPGFDLKRTSELFDTVYVSLYKYLGAPFGAVLTGRKDVIAEARELRHIYGSLLYQGWEAVLPPFDALPGFPARFLKAREAMEQLLDSARGGRRLHPRTRPKRKQHRVRPDSSRKARRVCPSVSQSADIRAATPKAGRMPLFINESILRRTSDELAAAILGS